MTIVINFVDIIKLIILVVVGVLIYYTLQKCPITYYIIPSGTNPEFKPETREILRTSYINTRYNIQEVDDRSAADIVIELRKRNTLDGEHYTPEYYPGTTKQIRFSFTWQAPKPYLAIDDINWTYGVPESGLSVSEYRKYVVRHEFMHALGFDHQPCDESTAVNGVCPVLYQSTRGAPAGFKCGQDAVDIDFTKKLPNAYIKY